MTLILYYHPFSSYCHKVLIALYEKEVAFEPYKIDLANPRQRAELAAVWPYARFPVLHHIDTGITLPESSIIVEYVDGLSSAGPQLLPADPAVNRNVRLFDRTLDNYLMTPMQRIVADRLRPEDKKDPAGVAEARAMLDTSYALLERRLNPTGWIAGPDFTLADCAAAPALFYAAKLAPLAAHLRLQAYLQRVMERPSFRRCLDEAQPYRQFFPSAPGDGDWPDDRSRLSF